MTTTAIDLHRLDLAYANLRVIERRQVAKLAAEIAQEGLRQPVLAVQRADRFVLIDGYRRVAAVRSLGKDTVEVVTLALSERDALLFAFRTASSRRRSALEDGWLFCELIETFELRQLELAGLLARSTCFVSRRLALVKELPTSIQKAVREGRSARTPPRRPWCRYRAATGSTPSVSWRTSPIYGRQRGRSRACTPPGDRPTRRPARES